MSERIWIVRGCGYVALRRPADGGGLPDLEVVRMTPGEARRIGRDLVTLADEAEMAAVGLLAEDDQEARSGEAATGMQRNKP